MATLPRTEDAVELCGRLFASPVKSIVRFPTGLCHYVYDVLLADGQPIVVRIAADENRFLIEGGIHWSSVLRPLGVPLPELLHTDAHAKPFGFMVLRRLTGTDLAHVYQALSPEQKQTLAVQLAAIQARVGTLPPGHGYGFSFRPDQPFRHRTWRSVLDANLARTYEWLKAIPSVDPVRIRQIEARLARDDAYLSAVAPTPFLDDITTKNVIIDNGRLTGIVDVDEVCFGDPLFALALTRMSLVARGLQTDYIDYWANVLALNSRQMDVLNLYTAIHCASFIGELGWRFNKDEAASIDPKELHRLLDVFDQLLRPH
ncbi:MAG TPA: phosphotransferase [Tepidisphaeraceae bacterium]|jgi:aminoglycoside phosphotransferase (APT) family kinase protein|nr:phosphotransferase [Tepidisphaeraceae bacterium]